MDPPFASSLLNDRRMALFARLDATLNEARMDLVQQEITLEDLIDVVLPCLLRSKWRVLDLCENLLTPRGGLEISRVLHLTRLKELSLGYNNLGDEGAISIARALLNCELTKLELEGNELTDAAVREISFVLQESKITELYLSYNSITDIGVIALCPKIAKLKVLDLFSNLLTDTGVIHLSDYLPSYLEELYLGENIAVTDAGVVRLSEALMHSNVKQLGLMKNSITDVGVRALTHAAKRCYLSEILLNGNPMSPECALELERVLMLSDTEWYQLIITLCSVREVPRLGAQTAFRVIPNELIRKVAVMLFDDEIALMDADEEQDEEQDAALTVAEGEQGEG